MMKRKIAIGSSNFEGFIEREAVLVDKTLLIHDIINEESDVLLVTRPRRWGKTLNMSMLKYFFSIPTNDDGSIDVEKRQKKVDAFSKLKISAYPELIKEYCGQHPVIFVSFKDVKESTYEEIKLNIRHLIYEVYKSHIYLLKSQKLDDTDKILLQSYIEKEFDDAELKESLLNLSKILYKHFGKKAIVLIDEYDTPMNDWYANALAREHVDGDSDQLLQHILFLFQGLFGAALKDNDYLEKAVITGILRIAKASLFSGLNNLSEDSVLDHNYARHFGFTEEEVENLLNETEMNCDEVAVKNLRSWYNGYNIGGITIYNPWSIMNYLKSRGEFMAYWVGTANTTLIESALILDKFQEEVQTLMEGNTVKVIADPKMVFGDIKSSSDALYNLLLFSGYLTSQTIEQGKAGTYNCTVRIPNKEILEIFEVSIMQWLGCKFNINRRELAGFIYCLVEDKIDIFTVELKKYLSVSASFIDTGIKAEVFYKGFMTCLFAVLSDSYKIESEIESGSGRIDHVLNPKLNTKNRNSFIIEYKIAHKLEDLKNEAETALNQINLKNYDQKISAYENIGKIIKIGLAFCGKEVEVAWG